MLIAAAVLAGLLSGLSKEGGQVLKSTRECVNIVTTQTVNTLTRMRHSRTPMIATRLRSPAQDMMITIRQLRVDGIAAAVKMEHCLLTEIRIAPLHQHGCGGRRGVT